MKYFVLTICMAASIASYVPDKTFGGEVIRQVTTDISGMTRGVSAQYKEILGHRESSNNYSARNSYGFSGRWQMGAAALFDTGYVTTKSNRSLSGDVWTAKAKTMGVNSLAEFLQNKNGIQDRQFVEYTDQNYRVLKRLGVIRDGMTQREIAGWLAAAHLKGPLGAKALSLGRDNYDANNTSASSYFRMMAKIAE